jgi:hypothetical protein
VKHGGGEITGGSGGITGGGSGYNGNSGSGEEASRC